MYLLLVNENRPRQGREPKALVQRVGTQETQCHKIPKYCSTLFRSTDLMKLWITRTGPKVCIPMVCTSQKASGFNQLYV